MDASNLEFCSQSFDIITGEDCLHHILKYEGTIQNMYRVLKPGGKGYFCEPFAFNPLINILRKINVMIKRRDYEQFLTNEDLISIKKNFDTFLKTITFE
jgi:ubiquinone/menaquinone biosynthesis C-methylase UbiE